MTAAGPVLSPRALNRALLDRQLLLRPARMTAPETVEHLIGLQAQAPFPPYYGLWSRLVDFGPQELAELLLERQVVRAVLMRNTVHLVSARDCLALAPLLQPMLRRGLFGDQTFDAELRRVADPETVAATGRALVEEEPRTSKELGALLAERWPDIAPRALTRVVRHLVPLVQVPPRGVWGRSGQPTLTTVEHWLGRPLDARPDPDALVLRYLGAFGPASVADAQKWSGLTGLGDVMDRLRPRLRTFRDERGRELFDLPEAPRPGPDVPAPVKLVAEFDNLLLSHADRARIMDDGYRARVMGKNAVIKGTVLVDGFVRGVWRTEERRRERSAAAVITAFEPLTDADAEAVVAEGERLLAFATPLAQTRTVRFAPPE
ncbi:winged helix DNA-binding domain-containing protein [Streptomyces sp. ACA25]|uniref:winged helix DNA-binding domain-containing protein n=1 Tax=Streptomyces sp. ACA25 TaxID=3022596 RepID=UPI002307503C|nr:winged helix DNA-binding domain-containing protein [Streptomyces sp. ACA25]MDB1088386.1 winged helix DNA-binding domain-containing protein [Streptomyces sp. ACA25]